MVRRCYTSQYKPFEKILVANRGEIACKVIEKAHQMGIRTVAVYSEADARERHVELADEAICLSGKSLKDTYLSIPRLLEAIHESGADAVHPGYGFLSENATWVKTLEEQGVNFIGPSAAAIAAMGDKIQSKRLALESGMSCIPGGDKEVRFVDEALQAANHIGYPVMLKASAGGGGKGMRVAWNDMELVDGFYQAADESRLAFGDNRLLVEKYMDLARHVELSILGDRYGSVVYLPERECSIQRRNQKVVEETPSRCVDEDMRARMGAQAVALAKRVHYSTTGTVEFLVDPITRDFYFLEMNTRLQVEYPITEMVTGIDLIAEQIQLAAGRRLALEQSQVALDGYAIEARVYAEDPARENLPSVGRLVAYQEPAGVRCDAGVRQGSEVTVDYDPLLSKVITHGPTHQAAAAAMVSALDEYVIEGVEHNIPLLRAIVCHPSFLCGHTTTRFLPDYFPGGFRPTVDPRSFAILTAICGALWAKKEASYHHHGLPTLTASWIRLFDDHQYHKAPIEVSMQDQDTYEVLMSNDREKVHLSLCWPLDGQLAYATLGTDNVVLQYIDADDTGQFTVRFQGNKYRVMVMGEKEHKLDQWMKSRTKTDSSASQLHSPMPGRVIHLAVQQGDVVQEGDELVIVEAMKMQNVLRASRSGRIEKIHVMPGTAVKAGQVLIEWAT